MSEIDIMFLISAFVYAYAVLLWRVFDIRDDVREVKRLVDKLLLSKEKAEQEKQNDRS